jgi:glycine cleavage system H protein
MVVMLFVALVAIFLLLDAVRIYMHKRAPASEKAHEFKPFRSLETPLGIFFDPSHLWVRLNDSGEFRIGLDELVLQAVKDIERIELVPSGTPVRKGDKIGTLLAKGRKLELRSPISGTVISDNENSTRDASQLYEDPYFGAWLLKIWPTDPKESLKSMMLGEAAKKWMQRETQRFTDFLSQRATPALGTALADGAKPIMGALIFLDDEGWKDFEEQFLNNRQD